MTIDEAIAHALEAAGEQQERADSAELIDILCGLDVESCKECAADHRQLAEWLKELKEAKRLLKMAVEDMRWVDESTHNADGTCIMRKSEGCDDCPFDSDDVLWCKWKHEAEALKLIGEDEDDI